MLNARLTACMSLFFISVAWLGATSAQNFPSRPIRIVTSAAGNVNDSLSRMIAQGISGPLGQQVVVENRGGGFGPDATVVRATPDGYTVILTGSGAWISSLTQKLDWDPAKDFTPVTMVTRSPLLLVVHASVPAKSVKELIAYAKANPAALSYSRGGTGGTSHLAAELFKHMAGVNIVGVGYSSGNQESVDLLSGRVQMTISTVPSVTEKVKSGKMRALAITSLQPSPLAPDVPTLDSTLPGFEAGQTIAILAPAKTPAPIVNRLNEEIVRVLNRPDVKETILKTGSEAYGCSPRELGDKIASDLVKWGKVVKDANIKSE